MGWVRGWEVVPSGPHKDEKIKKWLGWPRIGIEDD